MSNIIQRCHRCDQPTGKCNEDSFWSFDGEPLCEECFDMIEEEVEDVGEIRAKTV